MEAVTLPAISGYGLLGDTRTAALVSAEGSIDWLCAPTFDGEPVFGALLGGPNAGTFRAGPALPARRLLRRYRPHTATLETVWATDGGTLSLTEAMVAEVSGSCCPRLSSSGGWRPRAHRRKPPSTLTRASANTTSAPASGQASIWCVNGDLWPCRSVAAAG